jgi:hypothetical protein
VFGVSNSECWNLLQAQGRLYSHLKDGLPQTWWQQTIGFAYPIFLCVIIAVCVICMLRLPSEKRRWKSYLFSVSCGTLVGAAGCLLTIKWFASFPGWLFPPWGVTGVEFGLTLEDLLFQPACTTLFYVFYRFITTNNIPSRSSHVSHTCIILTYAAIVLLSVFFLKTAGRLEIALYLIPGMALYWFSREYIIIKKFLVLQIFVLVFQATWDLMSVSVLHSIPGMAWASQWIYVSFDNAGNAFHSPVYLDYAKNRWAWIMYNPIESTPLLGICGGLLNCALFASGDKLFYPKPATQVTSATS